MQSEKKKESRNTYKKYFVAIFCFIEGKILHPFQSSNCLFSPNEHIFITVLGLCLNTHSSKKEITCAATE